MKVLMISHMYPSKFNKVAGIFVHEQVKVLVKEGVEIQVIAPIPWTPFPVKYLKNKWRRYSEFPSSEKWEDIIIYHPRYLEFQKTLFFASSGSRLFKGIQGLVGKIYKYFKFDIIHSHVALPDGYAGMKLSQRYKKPLIVTIHGQDIQQTIFKNKKCKENIEKVINFSKKTITVSNKLKNISEKQLKINSNKIVSISNGISLNDIFMNESKIFQKYKRKIVILSVSNLIGIKGIDLNLRAIASLKKKYSNIIYLIIGEGERKKSLEKLVKDLDLQDNVKFLRELSHHKVMEYMSICDIFSLPSWNEAFGVVYIEAIAHGKPVIGCRGQGIEDFVKHGKTGILVKPQDVDDLIKALDFLLSHPNKARAIGEEARKLVIENYTWDKNAEKTIKIYQEVLSNKN
jgi:glycosyltransferase involved in cell wall biosynthesis